VRALEEELAGVFRGERSVVLLVGEPGIGKTRMLEELASRAIARGGVVAWGRPSEVGLTSPFLPWIQVLTALETPEQRAPSLVHFEQSSDRVARLARFADIVAFVTRHAVRLPTVLLFDDVHAADPSSLELLEHVLPELLARPVLVALAARDQDTTEETASALARLQRAATCIYLDRLGPDDVAELVGTRSDPRRVFELSDGNPLFVHELLMSHDSRGALGLPRISSVRVLVRDRVTRLERRVREVLEAAALVGRDFRGQIVADMVEAEQIGSLLAPALRVGMVVATSPDGFRFSHALIAEAIADEIDGTERARLHLRAAYAIQRHEPEDASAIAHHLLSAGTSVAQAAVAAAERAAERCKAQLAFEDAAALLSRALSALRLSGRNDRKRRALLLCAQAEALQHASRHEQAADLCDEALNIVRAIEHPDETATGERAGSLFARIALTRGLECRFGRTDPALIRVLREALARLGDDTPDLRARLLARLAAAEQPAPDPRGPVALALQATELARTLAPRDRLEVLYGAASALIDYVAPEVLEPIYRETQTLARNTSPWIAVHTSLRSCFLALERLDRGDFDRKMRAYVAEAATLRLPQWTRYAHMLRALVALLDGRFRDAEEAVSESDAISRALGDTSTLWTLDVHRAMAAWVKTTSVDAAVRARIADYAPGRAAVAAWLGVQDGSGDAVRTALRELGGHIPTDPDLGAMVGIAAAFVDDPSVATTTYEGLAQRSGRIVVAGLVGCTVFDLYDRVLLGLAASAKRWDAALVHAERASAIAAKLGSPVWTARVQADWAEALRGRARDGDDARAAELLAEARRTAERLGMSGLAHRCRVTLERAMSPPRDLGVAPSTESAKRQGGSNAAGLADRVEVVRHGPLWVVAGFGERVHIKDSRGMRMVARLVERPGTALHVLDLAEAHAADGGDAGPAPDATAHKQYRARLTELQVEREQAETLGDSGRLERINEETEALSSELERAFGLSGRERKIGSASERARTNAQRRIAFTIQQVRSASTRLGQHLAATIRTGTYRMYDLKR
jgi:hypothetical protein